MAYPKNIKSLAISLNQQGYSAEKIVVFFQNRINEGKNKGFPFLIEIAERCSLEFTEADWAFLSGGVPVAKTIRQWFSYNSRIDTVISDGSELTNNEIGTSVSTTINGVTCKASPGEINVKMMRQWKIPARDAPKMLSEWRSFHNQNKHEYCVLYRDFIDDLNKREIPFEQAKGMLETGKRALMFDAENIQKDIELARAFRPWETREGHKQFFKEIDELYTPSKEKLLHLEEISVILKVLLAEVEIAKIIGRWENVLSMEERYPLFPNTMDHCLSVGREFSKLELEQFHLNRETETIKDLIEKEKPPLASDDFTRSVLYTAICYSLKMSVRYNLLINESRKYELSVDICSTPIKIAQGTQQEMENYEALHTELVGRYRKNQKFKAVVKQRRNILKQLQKLEVEINTALSDPNFIHTSCLQCP